MAGGSGYDVVVDVDAEVRCFRPKMALQEPAIVTKS